MTSPTTPGWQSSRPAHRVVHRRGRPQLERGTLLGVDDDFEEYDPFDQALYADLGHIVMAWSRVEYLQKMLLARLAGADQAVAYLITGDLPAGKVIEKCLWVANASLEDPHRSRVIAWLEAAKSALKARNRLFHGMWGRAQQAGPATPVQHSIVVQKGQVRFTQQVVAASESCSAASRLAARRSFSAGLMPACRSESHAGERSGRALRVP